MNEKETKNDLLESRRWLDSEKGSVIRGFLGRFFPHGIQGYVLHHHYGQAEEYFVLMVNGNFIVEMECTKSGVVEYDISKINQYLADNRGISKTFRRTIKISKELSLKS